ncbi:MAG TPA: alpha/beta fold hydrolase [Candidatus Limnocylindria bacterium]
MEQRIGFVETPHGRVAYATTGSGPALFCDTGWVSHLDVWRRGDAYRAFFERLAEHHTLIRYDKPGTGLSDRTRDDLSAEPEVRAVEAIVEALAIRRLTFLGMSQGGTIAARYTARHPDVVERLVLYGTFARGADLARPDVRDSVAALTRAHWGMGSKTLADLFVAGCDPETERWFVEAQRASADGEMAARLLEAIYATDVTDELRRIRCPTLVLHRERDHAIAFAAGREVAALVPGATFVPLPGAAHIAYVAEAQPVLDAILDFIGDGRSATSPLTPREVEVASLVADGLTNAEIALRLDVAPKTVDAHVEHIRNKLAMRSRTQIGVWATEHGLRRTKTVAER